jgi:antitoxin (DNA-binding transcriptional repressor) of toxin-antitoxin stability system
MSSGRRRLTLPARVEGEIIVTRDSKPIARLLPFLASATAKRRRFDPIAHMRWLRRFWADKPKPQSSDELLAGERAD